MSPTGEEGAFWDPLTAEPVPKKVDEEWKRKAREESRKVTSAPEAPADRTSGKGTAASARPSAHFVELLTEIATQAALHLQGRHLDQARFNIEILEALHEKTRGNLLEEEQKILDRYRYELQMQYVQASRADKRSPKSPA